MILLFVWQTVQAQTIEDKLSFLVEPKVQHEAEVRTPSSLALIRQELKQQYLLAQKRKATLVFGSSKSNS